MLCVYIKKYINIYIVIMDDIMIIVEENGTHRTRRLYDALIYRLILLTP